MVLVESHLRGSRGVGDDGVGAGALLDHSILALLTDSHHCLHLHREVWKGLGRAVGLERDQQQLPLIRPLLRS